MSLPRLLGLCLSAALVTLPGLAECQLKLSAALPFKAEGNRLWVDTRVNGAPIRAILDTGAYRTVLMQSAADRLGLTTRQVESVRFQGVSGRSGAARIKVADLTIAGSRFEDLDLLAVVDHQGLGTEMLLGQDLLAGDMEIDMKAGMARLIRPEGCLGQPLAYWAPGKTIGEVPLTDQLHDGVYELNKTARFTMDVEINGQPVRALLDTGAAGSIMDMATAARLGLTPDSPGVRYVGKSGGIGTSKVETWIATIDSFKIGGETLHKVPIRFGTVYRGPADPVEMLLGLDWLQAHHVLASRTQRRLYFTYEGGPVFSPSMQPYIPLPRQSQVTDN